MSAPTTPQTATQWKYLAPNPKSAYKQLFVKGTRIRAEVVYREAMSPGPRTPEEIAADYQLPLEAVKEAIAYCASNPPEIDEDRRGEERVMEATGMNDPDYKLGGRYKGLTAQERARLGI
jgi:uncharacterized protein (DUF433 family)